jgi:hypothetical protein
MSTTILILYGVFVIALIALIHAWFKYKGAFTYSINITKVLNEEAESMRVKHFRDLYEKSNMENINLRKKLKQSRESNQKLLTEIKRLDEVVAKIEVLA